MTRTWTTQAIEQALAEGLRMLDAGYRLEVATRVSQLPSGALACAFAQRTRGARRPPQLTHRTVSAEDSFATTDPDRVALLDPDLNPEGVAWQVARSSSRALWWRCEQGPDHRWRAPVNNVVKNRSGCPSCHGLQVCLANSLETVFPDLVPQMHPTLNGAMRADHVVARGHTPIWWRCRVGPDHVWCTSPKLRGIGQGCPACANQQLSATNTLAATAPDLAAQLDSEACGLTANDLVATSNRRVAWKCDVAQDHRWWTTVSARRRGHGCPCCSNKQLSVTNRLDLLYPNLALELDPALNEGITPDQVVATTDRRFEWRCRRNPAHTWSTTPHVRVRAGSGCPHCLVTPRSAQEVHLAFQLAAVLRIDHAAHAVRTGRKSWDVDILAPDVKVIVEFDGAYWHDKKLEADTRKTTSLTEAGWTVVRVREQPLPHIGPLDVSVPLASPAFDTALAVLARLREVVPDLAELDAAGAAARAAAAEAFLDELRLARAKRALPPQEASHRAVADSAS